MVMVLCWYWLVCCVCWCWCPDVWLCMAMFCVPCWWFSLMVCVVADDSGDRMMTYCVDALKCWWESTIVLMTCVDVFYVEMLVFLCCVLRTCAAAWRRVEADRSAVLMSMLVCWLCVLVIALMGWRADVLVLIFFSSCAASWYVEVLVLTYQVLLWWSQDLGNSFSVA